jgi:hypothetical protein
VTIKDFLSRLDVIAVLGFLIAIETQITNGSMSFAHTLPEVWIPVVKEWAANLASAGGLLVGVMRMTGNSASATSAVIKTLFVAFVVSALLAVPSAQAQTAKPITKAAAQANPIAVLQAFAVTDLQNALDDANAQTPPDQTSAQCYSALIPLVQQAQGIKGAIPKSLGLFQVLQKTRDAKRLLASLQSPDGPLSKINLACAPLAMDTQNTLVQLGILSGAVAASGGLTLPIALPALAF